MSAPRSPPPDYRQHLIVETPEHVLLDLEIAGIGSRAFAALLDMLILSTATLAVAAALAILGGYGLTVGRTGAAVLLIIGTASWTGYFVLFEGLRNGQTPGKRIAGIRVLADTGHAITPGAAVVRNLLRAADFLPPPYLLGALLVGFHPRGKRLGDLVGGTVVVRDRPQESAAVRRAIEPGVPAAPELADADFHLLSQFAERQADLAPDARTRLAASLAARLSAFPAAAGSSLLDHLLTLHAREGARREGSLGGHGTSGAAARFVAAKRKRWETFERLAARAAREGLDRFESNELPDFAARYREIAADLARARTYGAEPAVQFRLERLAAAGHNALYRDDRATWRRLWAVLARECPAAIVEARSYVLVAFLAFALPAAGGYALLRERPALAAELLPDVMLRRAESGTGRRAEGLGYVDVSLEDRPLMASGIITNNVRIAISCFAGGIFLGVGSLVLLAFNGLAIGASAGHFANVGLLGYLGLFIVGHGVLELFAIWVAGAAGFLLGRAVVAPGVLGRADALVLNGRRAVRMVGGAALMLLVAGLIEGFVSASAGGLVVRVGAAIVSVIFLGFYLAAGAQSARNIERMRIASASISRRLDTVSASMRDSLSSNS